MSYLALARKYRPQSFSEVVGQNHIVKTLSNAIKNSRISHAYLFIGPRGIGKTSVARIFSKSLNCAEGPTLEPCGMCESCNSIREGQNIDVIEFDAASYRTVGEVQEKIIENVHYKPVSANYKIYIIDEVHMFSKHAFNSLLKTLEEPPPHVIFIFATTEPQKIPETITSRCQRFVFQRISLDDIKERLERIVEKEGKKITEDASLLIAKVSDGIMRDAESLLDQIISLSDGKITLEDVELLTGAKEEKVANDLLKIVLEKPFIESIEFLQNIEKEGVNLKNLLSRFTYLFRDALIYKNTDGSDLLFNKYNEKLLKKVNDKYTESNLTVIVDILFEALSSFRYQTEKRVLFEMALYKIKNINNLIKVDDMTQNDKLESKASAEIVKNDNGSIDWKKTIIKSAASRSMDHVVSILKKARFAVNKKGILYIAWKNDFYYKKGIGKKDKIGEIIDEVDSTQQFKLYKIKSEKKDNNGKKKSKKKKKTGLSEEVLKFKSEFNGSIIDIKEE
ncbi:MAG: DNA polymerase III subunit gamma/tau [Candidatus Mcinerneyibacterium aminivorans]|jgi:DNA polymerase-3 subunit gamma/tau|uniref:DNA polymerase III subunit gamma/tau n=1 Tax=Candidatus Mcinerneyibacterium aminivorans TaxID=2703815 RepID=A0A5D0MJ75_9BACT|nr:MAG: DNA polymerase III subunit gamma/tau [Candidatus Mcinerneyibacterium aminivorans]